MGVELERSGSAWVLQDLLVRTDDLRLKVAVAAACVGSATAFRLMLGLLLGPTLIFAAFYPAVLVSSLIGGPIAGLGAVALSVISVWWGLSEPFFQFGRVSSDQATDLALFVASSVLVVWLASVHRRVLCELSDKEAERVLLAREVQHRSQNVIAGVSSLVRQTVKDREAAEILIRRMSLMASSDSLLEKPKGSSGSLKELLRETVCKAFGDRVALAGDDLTLRPDQSRSLALVFHELTTNALKYGALSNGEGRVRIEWTQTAIDLTINWQECDGPAVAAPSRYNFGAKLIIATLGRIDGRLEPKYPPSGYCYRITVPI
ncbi:signal transduction histidine kinase [Rhodopseudomonas palustris TIE-1]|uniref:sensor histidine kinase n=1 Tax=Rhodopseudomonas palustris TaxID=1076 RepID=UPI00017797C2|nr:DUF4118 domain-containing protein [Rhodopseudomonas palustris]ACF02318.1 signal transduction histidine kinase [Rhodopseudomonas palustris TIE-1]